MTRFISLPSDNSTQSAIEDEGFACVVIEFHVVFGAFFNDLQEVNICGHCVFADE